MMASSTQLAGSPITPPPPPAAAAPPAVLAAKALLRPDWQPSSWPPRPPRSTALFSASAAGDVAPPPAEQQQVHFVADASLLENEQFRNELDEPRLPALLGGLLHSWAALPTTAESTHPHQWTLRNLEKRLVGRLCQCGETALGETVSVPFDDFVQQYTARGHLSDRNPMLVFDAILIEQLHNEAVQAAHAAAVAEAASRVRCEPGSVGDRTLRQAALAASDAAAAARTRDLSCDFAAPALFCGDDFLRLLGPVERPPHQWILVGPAGSGSPVHTDPMGTSAWNALLVGQVHSYATTIDMSQAIKTVVCAL